MPAAEIEKYGMRFPEGITELDIELWCYAHDKRPEGQNGRLTRWEHFKNAADMLWNVEGSTRRVIWNPWTEKMIKAMIRNRYVGLAGCGSSGKSDAAALFSLIEWLSAPTETTILITSTTIDGARKRVWKSVTEYWNALEARWEKEGLTLPGKMVQSRARIVGLDSNGRFDEAIGISIVAADQSEDASAAKKLKGTKAPGGGGGKLRLIADELSDLGYSVLAAGIGNLNTNPDFKMIGMSNPSMRLDPFGQFCEPKAGWRSVTVADEEWETRFGVCIRFNATKSPRLTEPDGERFFWMPSREDIEQAKIGFGETSREFWAQFVGMWCPEGQGNMVWTENELLAVTETPEPQWDGETLNVLGLDPGFTTGGDRSVAIWGKVGKVRGRKHLHLSGWRLLNEGMTEEKMLKARQIGDDAEDAEMDTTSWNVIQDFKSLAAELGVSPLRAGVDNTGGGVVFCQWLAREWRPQFRKVNFGGVPVERASMFGRNESDYADRVSQLWCQPKGLVRERQISGIPIEIVNELCMRKMHDKPTGGRMKVEPKPEMKKRTGKSPDIADAFVVLVEVCLVNGLLDLEEIKKTAREEAKKWKGQSTSLPSGRKIRIATRVAKPLIYRK